MASVLLRRFAFAVKSEAEWSVSDEGVKAAGSQSAFTGTRAPQLAPTSFSRRSTRQHLAEQTMDEVENLVHEASVRLIRVELVFHPDSDAAALARQAFGQIYTAHFELTLFFGSDEGVQAATFHSTWERCTAALDAIRDFTREAAQAARRPGRRRFPRGAPTVVIAASEPKRELPESEQLGS